MLMLLQNLTEAETYAETMTPSAWVFLAVVWLAVVALNVFAFGRILRTREHFDPDGLGPEHPPVPPSQDPGA